MWKMIVLLWSIPLVLGIVALARLGRGESVLRDDEKQFLLGKNKNSSEMRLSTWQGIKLAVLSMLLFLTGIVQGLVVANFGAFWTMLVPFMTAVCVILLLVVWLRSASSEDSRAEQDAAHNESHQRSTPAHRLDGFEL